MKYPTLPRVTLGWDLKPTIALPSDSQYILPRKAERLIHDVYYERVVKTPIGDWPTDPDTGRALEMEEPPR